MLFGKPIWTPKTLFLDLESDRRRSKFSAAQASSAPKEVLYSYAPLSLAPLYYLLPPLLPK